MSRGDAEPVPDDGARGLGQPPSVGASAPARGALPSVASEGETTPDPSRVGRTIRNPRESADITAVWGKGAAKSAARQLRPSAARAHCSEHRIYSPKCGDCQAAGGPGGPDRRVVEDPLRTSQNWRRMTEIALDLLRAKDR